MIYLIVGNSTPAPSPHNPPKTWRSLKRSSAGLQCSFERIFLGRGHAGAAYATASAGSPTSAAILSHSAYAGFGVWAGLARPRGLLVHDVLTVEAPAAASADCRAHLPTKFDLLPILPPNSKSFPPAGFLERHEVGYQRDRVRPVGANECIHVGIIGRRVLADLGCLGCGDIASFTVEPGAAASSRLTTAGSRQVVSRVSAISIISPRR
jgi:hypothetical protein